MIQVHHNRLVLIMNHIYNRFLVKAKVFYQIVLSTQYKIYWYQLYQRKYYVHSKYTTITLPGT